MNGLKDLIAKKKQQSKEQLGDRKWLKRSEREALESRGAAPAEPSPKKHLSQAVRSGQARSSAADGAADDDLRRKRSVEQAEELDLPVAEVKRRLRRLGHPATLFGEDGTARKKRLLQAERDISVRDEEAGGGDGNALLELQKEERKRHEGGAGGAQGRPAAQGTPVKASDTAAADGDGAGEAAAQEEEEDPTLRTFRQAAERLKQQQALASMTREQKIIHYIKGYMADWHADLEARAPAARLTMEGKRATDAYRMTEKALDALYGRLRRNDDSVHEEVKAGMLLMLNAMRDRNYQAANEVYHKLAIGNAPWPIGVTSVGIHERSAREKISTYANRTSQAHIMNDESTRKFLQGMKRLMTAVQRLYPTDPSRSVDFNAVEHDGLGARGGREKQLLLQSEAAGDTWKRQGLPAAPHFLAKDGSVSVPPTWSNILRSQEAKGDK